MTVCKTCKGVGYIIVEDRYSTYFDECYECDGKGVVEPMTNEEYIRSCSTEQLALLISVIVGNAIAKHDNGIDDDLETKHWLEWLKEMHE